MGKYVPNPTHESDVNTMVGFNKIIGGKYPTPDQIFVELEVVKKDKSDCAILLYSSYFCVEAIGNEIRIDDVITYSCTFWHNFKLLFIIHLK